LPAIGDSNCALQAHFNRLKRSIMKKILCIHGIGGKDATMEKWRLDWEKTIRESSGFEEELTYHFLKIALSH